MIGLIQRVTHASVSADHAVCGEINQGILLLLGIQREDDQSPRRAAFRENTQLSHFCRQCQGKMNFSLRDINGGLLIVSQFTLAADTKKGLRAELYLRRRAGTCRSPLQSLYCAGQNAAITTAQCGIFGRRYASLPVQ